MNNITNPVELSTPLVSCITPTRSRPGFVREALECFRSQTWKPIELVIIDDRADPSFANPPSDPKIRYHLFGKRYSIGAKRNIAVSRARGDIICHLDDDDWSAPTRVEDQVTRLLESGAPVTWYHSMEFRDGNTSWIYNYSGATRYVLGTSLCYRRDYWRSNPFLDMNEGEDGHFAQKAFAAQSFVSVDAGDLMWARTHAGNTSHRDVTRTAQWQRVEAVTA